MLVGLVVALPALRLGGLPLALATLALAILGDNVLFQWNWLRNTNAGWTIPRPRIGPLEPRQQPDDGDLLLVLVLMVMLLINNLDASWGRSIAAVRSSEVGAATSGVSPVRVKLALFAVSAAIAGVGGIMYAAFQTNVSNSTTPSTSGLLWLAVVVLFGIRRPAAAAYAGVASAMTPVIIGSGFHWWSWVPTWLSWNGTPSSEIPLILFGLGAVTLARNPDGFLAANAAQRYNRRVRKAAAQAAAPGRGGAPLAAEEEAPSPPRRSATRSASSPRAAGPAPSTAVQDGLLVVRGLRVGYGDVEVLHGVDLAVRRARSPPCSAPTAAASRRCARPSPVWSPCPRGRSCLDGEDVTGVAAHRRVGRGVLVAPESRGIFPGLTVEENLMLRLDAGDREEVYATLPRARRAPPPGVGQPVGRRAADAHPGPAARAARPASCVVDEPTLGPGADRGRGARQLFRELRDRGTAILLVEEKVRDVLAIADHVAFIELGHIVWSGPRSDVDDERMVGAYLGAQM